MTATSITGLAQVHSTRAQYDEALRLYAYALAILEASLGPDHPSVTHALNGLGETHRAVGRAAEAIALLERALATRAVSSVQSEELAESRPRRPDEPASSPSRRCEATPRRSARSASGPRSARGWRPL